VQKAEHRPDEREQREGTHNADKEGFPPNGTCYYHPDQVGNVRYITNSEGIKVYETAYAPYGEKVASKTTATVNPSHYMYTSQEDDGTGLYYYQARFYDPEIARFAGADTIIDGVDQVAGYNRYMYCHGNPIIYNDPTGHITSDSWTSSPYYTPTPTGNGGKKTSGGGKTTTQPTTTQPETTQPESTQPVATSGSGSSQPTSPESHSGGSSGTPTAEPTKPMSRDDNPSSPRSAIVGGEIKTYDVYYRGYPAWVRGEDAKELYDYLKASGQRDVMNSIQETFINSLKKGGPSGRPLPLGKNWKDDPFIGGIYRKLRNEMLAIGIPSLIMGAGTVSAYAVRNLLVGVAFNRVDPKIGTKGIQLNGIKFNNIHFEEKENKVHFDLIDVADDPAGHVWYDYLKR
jgi:RHS repeat-associated protein